MIDVMIVEDEYLIRELIIGSVNWEVLGLNVVSEVEDGKEALASIERLRPDLILMDINIPHINGIELSKIVYEDYPEIKIIIITGCNDFEYARLALKYGILEYLMKPINPDTLHTVLMKSKIQIESEKEQAVILQSAVEQAKDEERIVFFNKMIYSQENCKPEYCQMFYNFFPEFRDQNFAFIFASVDDLFSRFSSIIEVEATVTNIIRIFNDASRDFESTVFFQSKDHLIYGCYSYLGNTQDWEKFIRKFWTEVSEKVRISEQLTLNMVCSEKVATDAVCTTLQELQNAASCRFILGRNNIFMLPELREALGYRTELPFESDTFINDLSMNNISSFKTRVDTLFEEIKTKNLEKENTLFILMHLFGIIVDHCKQHKHKHTEFLEKRTFYFKEIQKKEFLEDIYILFSNIITDYLITGNINCSSKGKIINQAKSIIDKSYHKTDLTVEDIAQEVGVHANYLSQIFREEYGITVKSYILDRKLNHAKELILRDNNMMLYEVAFAVGYEDPYYFSKCFKKKYGVTPTQFMRDSYFIHSENSREPVID